MNMSLISPARVLKYVKKSGWKKISGIDVPLVYIIILILKIMCVE